MNPITWIGFLSPDKPYSNNLPPPIPTHSTSENFVLSASIACKPRRSPEGSAETIPTFIFNYLKMPLVEL